MHEKNDMDGFWKWWSEAAEKGYLGAHHDHFGNWLTAIRGGDSVVEDAIFGYRAAAPALACNDSYYENKAILWDPKNMKLRK